MTQGTATTRRFEDTGTGPVVLDDISFDNTKVAFTNCVDRLEYLLDRETEALRSCNVVDFDDLNRRKAHMLLEFVRVSRALPASASTPVMERLEILQKKLAENSMMLDQHLRAMSEIAGIIIRSIEQLESDGTYSSRRAANR